MPFTPRAGDILTLRGGLIARPYTFNEVNNEHHIVSIQ